ncbi:hypothetical protein SSX86_001337 [Deinandra increscens subsp. villosa]|uniref:Miraculin n=1 Tax=Deinandra increscens subsp. villosa TaxID=3103831 RepID=A0AAP0HAQ3_9ASTR
MKTNITILFSLAFILCIFKANSDPAPAPVRDISGNVLRTGVEYAAFPTSIDGFGGSIAPAAIGNNESCPAGVIEFQTDEHARLFTLTPVDPKKGVIRVSSDVNIKFSGSAICGESNVWNLKYDKGMKQYAVMVEGVEGNPGRETVDNWFKIEKTNDGYKFVFCPSVCSYCKVMCRDVGTTIDQNIGVTRLVLGGDPLSFNFYT